MTALDDSEDSPPNERPTAPFSEAPEPLEHFDESVPAAEAPTEPPPPVDEALAAAVAAIVIGALGKKLDNLTDTVLDTRQQLRELKAKAEAFDNAFRGAFQLVNDAGSNIDRIADAIGPRSEGQQPIFATLRQNAERLDDICAFLLGRATVHELQSAEERRRIASTDRPPR